MLFLFTSKDVKERTPVGFVRSMRQMRVTAQCAVSSALAKTDSIFGIKDYATTAMMSLRLIPTSERKCHEPERA
jgi:hypothetical protein